MQPFYFSSHHHIRNYFLQMNLKYLSWILLFLTECFSFEFFSLRFWWILKKKKALYYGDVQISTDTGSDNNEASGGSHWFQHDISFFVPAPHEHGRLHRQQPEWEGKARYPSTSSFGPVETMEVFWPPRGARRGQRVGPGRHGLLPSDISK